MAFAGPTRRSVYPSADACTTASVAMLPEAPGRFSTVTGWPSRPDSHCAIKRPRMSLGPPAGKPTMRWIGRAGYDWALAVFSMAAKAAPAPVRPRNRRRGICILGKSS
jgi:hypothetical protein